MLLTTTLIRANPLVQSENDKSETKYEERDGDDRNESKYEAEMDVRAPAHDSASKREAERYCCDDDNMDVIVFIQKRPPQTD